MFERLSTAETSCSYRRSVHYFPAWLTKKKRTREKTVDCCTKWDFKPKPACKLYKCLLSCS